MPSKLRSPLNTGSIPNKGNTITRSGMAKLKNLIPSSTKIQVGSIGGSIAALGAMGVASYTKNYHRRFMNTLLPQNTIPSESGRYGYRTSPSNTGTGITGIKFTIR